VKDIDWGDSIPSEVRLALEASVAVIVILSPASLKSSWVPFEVGYATALGKRIMPYLAHPALEVPSYMRDLRHATSLEEVRSLLRAVLPDTRIGSPTTPDSANDLAAPYRKACALMPELLAEMRQDISADESQLIRELLILPTKGVLFHSAKPRFVYYEDEHPNLRGKLDILEDSGFLRDISPGDVPIFRMSEEFMALVVDKDQAA
jgi:hypothetical protein